MEFTFYYTEVTWCWWEESKRKTAQEAVIVCATSYSQVAGIVEENYGDELVSIDKIEQISENKILPLSISSGRALRDAALNYGVAKVIEEKDFSKKPDEAVDSNNLLPKEVELETEAIINKTPKEVYWNPHTTPFPADTPKGTIIICDTSDSTYAQNWEGVAP